MQISRKAAAVAAAGLTGLASLGAAGAAFASSSAPATHDGVQVLRFHTIGVSQTVLPVAESRAMTTSCEPLRYIVYSTLPAIRTDE